MSKKTATKLVASPSKSKPAKVLAQQYRVIKLEKEVRDGVKAARLDQRCTIKSLLEQAVETQVPVILEQLAAVGIVACKSERRPVRWPMDDALITRLKAASVECGLPASSLLVAALRLACAAPAKKRSGRVAK